MGYFSISFSIFLMALASLVATCSQITSSSHQDLSLPVQSQKHQKTECCLHQHFSALLRLKRGFRFTYDSVTNLSSWNPENRDCCTWQGITCDTSTGHVIALDLSELGIFGQMDFQTLSRFGNSLQILNLAYNYFGASPIPPAIGQLYHLTYLNLSPCSFHGQIPMEMLRLTRLVSLDLSSYQLPLKLEKPSFRALVQNMSGLKELVLDGIRVSSDQEWSRTISSSLPNLHKLSMVDCSLSGPVHPSFSHLPFLSQLDLSHNNLLCAELDFIGNLSSLTSLRLAGCHGRFSGKNLSLHNLSELDLSYNVLSPAVLEIFIVNSSSLTSLSLWYCGLDGRHFVRILTLPRLSILDLGYNDFSFVKPDFASNVSSFKSLTRLTLTSCNMSGLLPSHLANLTRLELLDLSLNAFSGSIPSSYGVDLLNLREISLYRNLLSGKIPSSLFSLPSMMTLVLEDNRLSGQLDEFNNASSSPLHYIGLSNNMLQGMIPRSIFQLVNLAHLSLYSNNFNDTLNLDLFLNLTELSYLAISHVNISVKDGSSDLTSMSLPQLWLLSLRYCNLKRFPNFLRYQEMLAYLDLSGNKMEGEIPLWIWKLANGNLVHLNLSHNALQTVQMPIPNISSSRLNDLDLSYNVLEGLLPIPSSSLVFYSVSANSLSGEVPLSICNLTSLRALYLSENNFSGPIPQCFSEMSNVLTVLNLRRNAFSGRLFQTVEQDCPLTILDLSENQFEGQLPSSLVNCKDLIVINIGDNHICGPFPSWIQQLANLRIVILRSNCFYGPIELPPTTKNFSSMLQIVDLSFNRFNGSLPSTIFLGWKGMTRVGNSKFEYFKSDMGNMYIISIDVAPFYYEPIIVRSKNLKMNFQKVPAVFVLVDFSSNYFEGQIPESIGILKSLQVLNMSHNSFTGQIPRSMKNLISLESLDLSQNNISGYIPQELSQLTFLEILNLSNNQLVGPIPHAKQFLTFTNESFQGNSGLCGPPLTKACEETDGASPSTSEDPDFELDSVYDWKIMATGFGIGYGVGMGVFYWTLVLWRKGRRAFNKLVYKVLFAILPSVV